MEGDDRTCPSGKRNMSGGRRHAEKRKLREIIITKCARKLAKTPLVKLERRDLGKSQRMKINTTSNLDVVDLIDIPGNGEGDIRALNDDAIEDESFPDNNIDENDDFSDEAFSENEVFEFLNVQPEEKQDMVDTNLDIFEDPSSMNSVDAASSEEEEQTKKRTFGRITSFQKEDSYPLDKTYECPSCQKTFKFYASFLTHQKKVHSVSHLKTNVKKLYKCNFCQKTHQSERKKRLHMVGIHLIQLYADKIPPNVTKKQLNATASFLSEKQKVYSSRRLGCPYCPRIFSLFCHVRGHLKDCHFDKILIALKNPEHSSLQPVQHIRHFGKLRSVSEAVSENDVNEALQDQKQDSLHDINLEDFEDEEEGLDKDKNSDNSDEEESCEEVLRAPKRTKIETRRATTTSLINRKHVRDEDSPKKTYECISCHQVFNTYGQFFIHQKKVHKVIHGLKLNSYKCDFCQRALPSEMRKLIHMASRHIMELYADKIPPGVTKDALKATAAILAEHQKVYNPRSLGCPYCPQLFSVFLSLKNHIQAQHFEKILIALENPEHSSLQRVECLQHEFGRLRAVSDAKSVKSYQCSICQKQFTVYSTFQSHKRHYHKRTISECGRCNYCELKFSRNSLFILHCYRKHAHSYLKDKLKLPPDSTQLQLEEGLDVLIEKGEIRPGRRIICTICKKVHLSRADLRIHILDNHLPSVVEKLKEIPVPEEDEEDSIWCAICKVMLDSKEVLEEHQQKLHPKDAFPCNYCTQSFRRDQDRKKHSMVLHGFQFFENLLPSGTTEEEFKAALEMVLSKRNKFEENGCSWFGCPRPECGEKVFKYNGELKRHVLHEHSQDVIDVLWK